jgi:L-2-hydroxyglutarate oxidase LhgO
VPSRGSDKADITIIGAGVIGLAVASQVAKEGRQVYIIEQSDTFGKETSSRNSQIIHSGIYYPPGSLKAETCLEGNAIIYEVCQKHGIGFEKTGKLIVATSNKERRVLESLLENGKRNGVQGLAMLSEAKVKEMEPNVKGKAAIFSPSSGVIDSHALMQYFDYSAREKGVKTAYRSRVVGIEKSADGYEIIIEDSSGRSSFPTRVLINCAGLNSDKIAEFAGIDIDRAGYRLHYCKGEYFSVGNNKNKMVKRLIYPVPEPDRASLGIHLTLDISGRMRLGPNARYVDEIDYSVDQKQKTSFYDSVKWFLPFIEYEDLEPEMAGIRPKLQGPGEPFRDFVIKHEAERGLPGLINLIGIESPGLTSAPSIARRVEDLVKEIL